MLRANEKIKIAVLVSGGGTNLQALMDAESQGLIPDGEIVLVVSSSQKAYAMQRAESRGIETAVVPKKNNPAFERQLLALLEEKNIELIVLAGFMCILSADFTARYKERIINIHPSLIPAFCGSGYYGLKVHEAALAYGVKVTGATVHYVNEIPDGGKILLQQAVPVLENDTPETLQKRVMEQAEWILLPKATQMVCHSIQQEKQQ